MFSPTNPFAEQPIMFDRAVLRPPELSVWVPGTPKPQGSKDYIGKGRMVESSKALPAWRADVRAALIVERTRVKGPVSVGLEFLFARPTRPTHPEAPAGPPDLDKLARGVLDALESAHVVENDARVVEFHRLVKRYVAAGEVPGCRITVRRWVS